MPKTTIEKRENELKTAFWQRFDHLFNRPTPRYFVLNIQDVRKCGYPDTALLGYQRTSYWEFKHATPDFKTQGVQEITCQIIDRHTFCRYIIFHEDAGVQSTLIVHPRDVRNKGGRTRGMLVEVSYPGFDFDALAHYIHGAHRP